MVGGYGLSYLKSRMLDVNVFVCLCVLDILYVCVCGKVGGAYRNAKSEVHYLQILVSEELKVPYISYLKWWMQHHYPMFCST